MHDVISHLYFVSSHAICYIILLLSYTNFLISSFSSFPLSHRTVPYCTVLQSMTSNYPYVRRLLKALADKMPHIDSPNGSTSEHQLNTQTPAPFPIPHTTSPLPISFSTSSSSSPGFRPVVSSEVMKANRRVELSLSGQETAMMMHGLRCMGSEWAQVRERKP